MDKKYYGIGGFLTSSDAANFLAYSEVYKSAVKILLDYFYEESGKEPLFFLEDLDGGIYEKKIYELDKETLPAHTFGILPIVFLFRHYVELQLKGLILLKGHRLKDMNHDIRYLLTVLIDVSKTSRISDDAKKFILEMQKWDASSDGFRYPQDKKGKPFFQGGSASFLSRINTLSDLKEIILTVIHDLENVEGDFEAEIENAENEAEMN